MKRLIQLAPRLSGVGAALFAGSALAAQMYLNPLAGETTVDKGIYGAVTADAEAGIEAYAGLTLPAPIAATSFSALTQLSNTDSAPIAGSYTELIKKPGNAAYVDTHTVSGWFKVNTLPTGTSIQVLWLTNNGTADAGGYQVAVNASGQLVIGRANSGGTFFDSGSATSTNQEGKITTNDTVITAGEWTHITVAFSVGEVGSTIPLSPSVFVNGASKALSAPTFKTNLNGNAGCSWIKLGAGISAAGFYVDGTAITDAETIRSLAVDPMKHIYAAQWTRNVSGGGWWRPTSEDFYPWSADGMTLTSTNPLVYRGSVTLSVTATEASTLTLNASPSLTALTTAYGTGGTAVLTLASGSNTLTATTTTISAKTVLDGTGFSLGNLSITSTGTLTVGENRNFTLAAIETGGKLILTPTAIELAAGQITLPKADTVTLSAKNVQITGYSSFTVSEGVLMLPIPVWTPTTENVEWSTNWTQGDTALESAPTSGPIKIDFSQLTEAFALTISTGAFDAVSFVGTDSEANTLVLTLGQGVTLGSLVVDGHVTLPASAVTEAVEILANKRLTLDCGAATAETPASLPTFTGTGTVSLTNGYATTAPFADFTGTLNLDATATLRVNDGAAVKSCRAITGSGTLRFQGVLPNKTSTTVDGVPGVTTAATWTGTVVVADYSARGSELHPNLYGNENSIVEFDGVEGYMYGLTVKNLRLTGEGLALLNGSTQSYVNVVIENLLGTGKFRGAMDGFSHWKYRVLIGSAANFEGSFNLEEANSKNDALIIQIGSTSAPSSDTNFVKHISIVGGAAVEAKKPWTPASNGNIRVVNGSLTLTGEQARIPSSFDISAEGSVVIATTGESIHAGALIGAGPFTVNAGAQLALTGANDNYNGAITVAYGATLTNAGSSATVPFGKGTIENNGTVKLMGAGTAASCGQLPPTSGSGNIVFCAGSTSRIPGEITTSGTVTFEGTTEETAAAAVTFITNATDFSGKKASIKGASVVVGAGVTLAKDEASTPLITIAAGRSLSGSGTINVPVAFENAATATMAPDATFTFNNALTVPKDVTLPGTITLGEGAVLSGAGTLSGTVTLNSGVIIDATKSTASGYLKLMGSSVTLGEKLKVKASKLTNVLDVQTSVGLDLAKVSLTDDSTIPTGAKLMTSVFETENTSITTLKFFVPPTVPKAPAESPRDSGVDTQIAQAAESYAGFGMIISEVTAITGTGSNGTGTREINGSSLFENVLTLTPVSVKDDGTYTAKVTVAYDFGVADMTIKRLQLEGDDDAKLYVLLAAKVQNSASSNTASFASGTKLTVLNGESELTPKSVSAADAGAAETTGVQWLAVPIETLFPDGTGTRPLKVKASNASAAN
ncbi:MAG: beta strand repeat-containing protein [Candidatus Spyradenecus sp.]